MKHKKTNIILLLSIIVIIIFSLSTVFSMVSLAKLISENDKEKSINYANEISDKVDSIFAKPKAVAQSIDNSIICDYVENLSKYTESAISKIFKDYLLDVVKRYNYDTAFIVPKANLHCYTEHGYSYYVDPEDDDNIWFGRFLNSGLEYELNVDNDQANDNKTTVYINIRMDDDYGTPIGACGVGVPLVDITSQLNKIELLQGYTVEFVSRNGKIQLSSKPEFQESIFSNDSEHLDNYVDSSLQQEIETYNRNSNYKYVQKDKKTSYMIKFIDEFQWYLVITHVAPKISASSYLLLQNLIVFIICMILILILTNLGLNRYQFKINELKVKSEIDILTGLFNRYAYEDKKKTLAEFETLEDISVVLIDINSLKMVNDTYGHNVGDELIQSAAKLVKNFYSPFGNSYRIGGDEFVVILENQFNTSPGVLFDKAQELKNIASKSKYSTIKGINLSVGVASGKMYEYVSIEKLIKIADSRMYEDKKLYYQNIEMDRRER